MKLKLNKTALIVAQALAALTLAGCGGADTTAQQTATLDDSDMAQAERLRWRSMDKESPSVEIDSQSGSGTGTLVLRGKAADNLRLYKVRWVNDRGGNGLAKLSGTYQAADWAASGIALQTGTNNLTITAEDAAGNRPGSVRRTRAPD